MKKQTTPLLLALALCLGICVPAFAAGAFSDVPQSGWAAPYVEQAAEKGWVSGVGGGKYEPNASVTYSQFAVMLGFMPMIPPPSPPGRSGGPPPVRRPPATVSSRTPIWPALRPGIPQPTPPSSGSRWPR